MKHHNCHYLLVVLLLLAGRVCAANSESATEQVDVRLMAASDTVYPGGTVLLGVNFRMLPHWHIYWKNPGDSGVATSIDYLVPVESTVSPVQWPAPSAIRFGPVINYGYENEVTLLNNLQIPRHAEPGTDFPVKAKLKWLVCKESCIPQEAELDMTLPVVAPGKSYDNGNRLIKAALASMPRTINAGHYSAHQKGRQLILSVDQSELPAPLTQARFFPDEWGRIQQSADQHRQVTGDGLVLTLEQGDEPLQPGGALKGVLVLSGDGARPDSKRSYQINAALGAAEGGNVQDRLPELRLSLISVLLMAFLGGFILNLMPCVLPVLSLKALALIKQAQLSPRQVRVQGWAYTAGILASFAALSGVFYGFRSAGEAVGWGFQFQSPLFVLLSAYLMFGVGLSLSGVFTVGTSIAGTGDRLTRRSGYAGSFFTGALAAIVATPCTAPFMATALGFAVTQPAHVFFATFFSLGLGLASPYLLLSHWPALQRYLPKPGLWMERLKQGLAVPMYASSIWLVWVLVRQIGIKALPLSMAGLVILGLAAWLYESTKADRFLGKGSCFVLIIVLLSGAAFSGYYATRLPLSAAMLSPLISEAGSFEPYSESRLRELRSQGKAVFVNLTASWCVTCLVNEKVALSRASVQDFFRQKDIAYLKGDWTNGDSEITKLLAQFDRSGVPFYIFYPADLEKPSERISAPLQTERYHAEPIILPQILTPDLIKRTLAAAMPAIVR